MLRACSRRLQRLYAARPSPAAPAQPAGSAAASGLALPCPSAPCPPFAAACASQQRDGLPSGAAVLPAGAAARSAGLLVAAWGRGFTSTSPACQAGSRGDHPPSASSPSSPSSSKSSSSVDPAPASAGSWQLATSRLPPVAPAASSPPSPEEVDRVLGEALARCEADDVEGSLAALEGLLGPLAAPGRGGPGEMPPLEELLALPSDVDLDREARRQREAARQAEAVARRVQQVDCLGRAYATGKRKTSAARVWLWPGSGLISVNRQPYTQYFPELLRRAEVLAPLRTTSTLGRYNVWASVKGGGIAGQAQAVRHGIARALQAHDPELHQLLKPHRLLTRDARVVERKKPGRKKARKAFQWVKR